MKKAIFFAATAALVLSSCSSDEITYDVAKKDVKGPKAIEVNAYTPGQTKAVEETTNVQNGFWANFQNGDIFDGKILYDGTEKAYVFDLNDGQDEPCWPDNPDETMTVVAVGGPDFEINPIEEGKIKVTPVTSAKETAEDIVTATFSSSLNDNGGNSAVSLNFEHILAKVQFYGAGAKSGYDYRVVGLTFSASKLDTYDIAAGEWSASEEGATATYNVFAQGTSYERQTLSNDMAPIMYDGTVEDDKETAGIPETDAAGRIMYAAPGTYTISVVYSTKPSGAADYEKDGSSYVTYTKTADVTLVAGKLNVIKLTLPQDGKTPITLDVDVDTWGADNNITENFTPKP